MNAVLTWRRRRSRDRIPSTGLRRIALEWGLDPEPIRLAEAHVCRPAHRYRCISPASGKE